MAKRLQGVGGVVGAVVAAALGSAVGCGDGFTGEDCRESHTCSSAAGETAVAGAADGGNSTASGGAGSDDTAPHSGAAPLGGAAALGGAADALAGAGGAVDTGCKSDAECSNGNAEDGAEVCEERECLAGNPPPAVVASTPASDAVDVEPDTSVVIEFSEPLDPKTVTSTTVQLMDGTTAVPCEPPVYADGKVTLKPAAPLTLLAPYTVSVTPGVKDTEGAPLLEAFKATFSVRDGVWHEAVNVAKDTRGVLSDVLPMKSDGSALVVWSGTPEAYCPAWARWFLRGAPAPEPAKSLGIAGQTECNFVSAGGNASGVSAVAWSEPTLDGGIDVAQYRGGAWLAMPALVSTDASADRLRLAVAPSGVVTLFEHVPGKSTAWTTNSAGAWPGDGEVISTFSAQGRTSVAFDAKGNGLAVWRAKDPKNAGLQRIVASQLNAADGKWLPAVDVPGSVTATAADEQRGVPAVAMDSNGDAMALWVDASITGKLMASRYRQQTGWASPEMISGALEVPLIHDAPALTFDGRAFVAAWQAADGSNLYAYTARYDLKTGWAPYDKQQTKAADGTSAPRMPRLVSDGRGNLLLVFVKGNSPAYSLVHQRYTGGAWSPLAAVPGGAVAVTQSIFQSTDILPLSISANGLAVLAWTNYDSVNYASTVRLASFY